MADYPYFDQLEGSHYEEVDGKRVDRSSSGTVRTQSFYDDVKKVFFPKHIITQAEKDTLDAFVTTNKDASDITFYWFEDSAPYTVLIQSRPKYQPIKAGIWSVEIELAEV